jgi:polar amino acid transport system permease protein
MAFSYEFDWSVLLRPEYRQVLLTGLGYTLLVAALSTAASLLLGSAIAAARLSSRAWIATVAGLWVGTARHVPGVFWVLFFYFAFPELLPSGLAQWLHGWGSYAVLAGVIALSLDNSTYVSDIVRAGVLSIPPGERDAARGCGLTPWQQWSCCLLPLTLRIVLPPLANRTIHNVKNSSLCMVIGVPELTWASQQVGSLSFRALEALVLVTAVYLLLGLLLGAWARRLERRHALRSEGVAWQRGQRELTPGAPA